MIELINATTGTRMWVANDRVSEYLAAGNELAVKVPDAPPTKRTVPRKRKTAAAKK